MTPIGKVRTYCIQFDVEQSGKAISGTRVDLSRFMERDTNAEFNISLCADPLYPALCAYVKANPLEEAK